LLLSLSASTIPKLHGPAGDFGEGEAGLVFLILSVGLREFLTDPSCMIALTSGYFGGPKVIGNSNLFFRCF
jgi:hypothetical protein